VGKFVKDIEVKLVSELMKNSRRSDRELAKVLGVSQPTVSRVIKKLEKEGVIRAYTMIPDFTKLGFSMMSLSFAKLKEPISEEKLNEVRKQVRQTLLRDPESAILGMRGMGLDSDRVIIKLHENYSAYSEHIDKVRQHPLIKFKDIKSFLIDLEDRNQYLPLTLSELANYITFTKLSKK
jgi:DNA-binding Lrp family transcriptional regulator